VADRRGPSNQANASIAIKIAKTTMIAMAVGAFHRRGARSQLYELIPTHQHRNTIRRLPQGADKIAQSGREGKMSKLGLMASIGDLLSTI
jgi:hypothetical protein